MIRIFCAIKIPSNIAKSLSQIHSPVIGARWLKPHNLHLTLEFIGNVDPLTYSEIADALQDVQYTQFELTIDGLGYFGKSDNPKIFWAGVSENESLRELQESVKEKLSSIVNLDHKPYVPHITLARLKNTQPWELRSLIDLNNTFETKTFTVEEFHLYRSDLTPSGAEYIVEKSFELY